MVTQVCLKTIYENNIPFPQHKKVVATRNGCCTLNIESRGHNLLCEILSRHIIDILSHLHKLMSSPKLSEPNMVTVRKKVKQLH